MKSQSVDDQAMKIKTYLQIESQKTYTGRNRRSRAGAEPAVFLLVVLAGGLLVTWLTTRL